jgi:protein-S-isoprenylcysteine O-methyltransferase Ste14
MSVLNKVVDERFLDHRRRSTSIAGVAGGVLAMALFAFRYFFEHVWSWDLLAIGVTMAAVKWALMIWYRLTD